MNCKLFPLELLTLIKEKILQCRSGLSYATVEVQANGITFKHTSIAADRKTSNQ